MINGRKKPCSKHFEFDLLYVSVVKQKDLIALSMINFILFWLLNFALCKKDKPRSL